MTDKRSEEGPRSIVPRGNGLSGAADRGVGPGVDRNRCNSDPEGGSLRSEWCLEEDLCGVWYRDSLSPRGLCVVGDS